MYDFVIIHGSFGSPFENWSPWLFETLVKRGKQVLVPQLPTINQNFSDWDNVFAGYDKFIDSNTSLIAHSLGPAFVVDYLLKRCKCVNNLYFAAPFYDLINIKEFDDANKTFFINPDISRVKPYFKKSFCLYSDNDPYVPIEMSRDFARQLSASELIIPGGKHLNASAGYTEFAELLEAIEKNG